MEQLYEIRAERGSFDDEHHDSIVVIEFVDAGMRFELARTAWLDDGDNRARVLSVSEGIRSELLHEIETLEGFDVDARIFYLEVVRAHARLHDLEQVLISWEVDM